MTRKELKNLGISEEHVLRIMKMNGADIEHAKAVKVEEIKRLQEEITRLKQQKDERYLQKEIVQVGIHDAKLGEGCINITYCRS